MTTCKNCGHQFDLDFCNKCGQKASVKRIEMKWLLYELPHAIWHIEKGFLYNVVQLFKRPGYAVAEYIEGKRKNFYHPVSYLLIILAVQYLLTNYFGTHWYDPKQDAGMTAEVAEDWKKYDRSQQIWATHYFEFIALSLPAITFIWWCTLRMLNRRYNYAESMVVAIFMLAQTFIPQVFAYLIFSLVNKTAFTRFLDPASAVLASTLIIYMVYQLGDVGISKKRRLLIGIVCALLIFILTFFMLYIETELLHKGE